MTGSFITRRGFGRAAGRWLGAGALGLIAGCAGKPPQPAPEAAPPPAPPQPAPAPPPVDTSFAGWLEAARAEAARRGISPATLSAALDGLAPIPRVIELDHQQPEFTQTFWRYFDNAVTPARIAQGRALMQQHAKLLGQIESQYGVPGRFLMAFWGLESNYGKIQGDFPVVAALATLAYDGRRAALFREEFFNALVILDRGHVTVDRMKGSWAGAMGNTQFMPSTFLRHAVDEDNDGRIDIWASVPDALGSAANYLKDLGWDKTRTWGREARLPAKFDASLASLDLDAKETIKPLSQWRALGVRRADGGELPDQDVAAALILPQGVKGPAFLVYDDFRIILKWNRSTFYAVAVGHLADRLAGGGALLTVKMIEPPLARDEVVTLQSGLAALGFFKAEADGIMGVMTRQAVRAFQRATGLAPDGYANAPLLAVVKNRSAVAAL